MAADEFTWVPSHTSRADREPRVAGVQYDDGYAQEAPSGLNNNPMKFNMVFRNIDRTEMKSIDDFLSGKGGSQSFTWTPPTPHNNQRRWKCKQWGWSYEGGVIVGVEAVFLESFQA